MTVTDLHPVADNPEPDQPNPDQPDAGRSAGSSPPDGSPEPPVALLLADPGELVLDANVRTSARLDKPFLASIRDLGVLVPVVAHRAVDGELRVLLGQRRTLAAVEVGRREIPVYVIDIPDDEKAREIARILGQVAENDDRQDLRGSERAAAFQQLTTLGLTATQVARRTHRKVGEVRAGVAVAGSELAGAAMDRFDLTLVQAAVLAEFDDDSSAVKALTVAAKQHPDQFDHVAQLLRDKRAATAVRARLVADLTAAGVRLLDNPPHGDLGIAKLEQLADGDGHLTAEAHAGCPGHAAYLRDHGSWDGKVDIAPVYVCTDWRRQGHQLRLGTPIDGLEPGQGGKMSEEQKAERRVVVANNKAWDSARAVRRGWLKAFLARKSAPKDAPQWTATTLAGCAHEVRRALEDGHQIALTLLGLVGETGWSPYGGKPHPITVVAATASPARAGVLTLGLLLGGLESTVTRDAWRRPTAGHRAYFQALRDWGYPLSEVEQLVLEPVTPARPDGDSDEADPEGDDEAVATADDDAAVDGAQDA